MRAAVLYGPRDVRFEERDVPKIIKATDAIIRISATCVCGSDLWPYRGINLVAQPTPMGHEYCGIVEEVGSAVTSIRPGQLVIGSFFASDNTCPNCQIGYQSSCQHKEFVGDAQASVLRVPLADGTLVATPDIPSDDLIPSLSRSGGGGLRRDGRAPGDQSAAAPVRSHGEKEVTFELVNGLINDLIDDAYRAKYKGSPYLSAMIGARARSATVKVMPRETKA